MANSTKENEHTKSMNSRTAASPTIYIDLDGTLLGQNASLLHDHEGNRTTAGIDALFAAETAGADLVVATGRDRYRAAEFCRSAGISRYIAELGCLLHTTGDDIIQYGSMAQDFIAEQSLNDAQFLNCVSDAAHALITHFPGQIELHAPYNRDRYASILMRGNVPIEEANDVLHSQGWPFLEFVANGYGMFRRTMPGVDNVLIYHVTPVGVTKATGIARDQELRSLDVENCFIIGDGMADAHCFDVVNTVYMPCNGPESDPEVKTYVDEHANIVVLDQSHNLGFAEAITQILAQY